MNMVRAPGRQDRRTAAPGVQDPAHDTGTESDEASGSSAGQQPVAGRRRPGAGGQTLPDRVEVRTLALAEIYHQTADRGRTPG
jgi:hypothetical protein